MLQAQKNKPCQDETLSSYLYRCQLKNDQRYSEIKSILNDFDHNWDQGFDPDYNYSQTGIKFMSAILECSVHDVIRMTSFNHYLLIQPRRSRRFFCPYCVLNDITLGRHPFWRKTWDDFLCVTCLEHVSPMSQLDESIVYSEKARVAFSKACVDFTSFGPFCHQPRVLSLPSLETSAGAWACLWLFGRHVQYVLTTSKNKNVLMRGFLKGLPWADCCSAIETTLGLSLRGHTKYFERRCLIYRALKSPTIYERAVETKDGMQKIMHGLTITNLTCRLFALLVVGIFWGMFTSAESDVLFRVLQRLDYSLPNNPRDLKRELLSSELTDYERVVEQLQATWPKHLRNYWLSC